MAEPTVKKIKRQTEDVACREKAVCHESTLIGYDDLTEGKQGYEYIEMEQQFSQDMLPACEHGHLCSETDLLHFAEYFHPLRVIQPTGVSTEIDDVTKKKCSCESTPAKNTDTIEQEITSTLEKDEASVVFRNDKPGNDVGFLHQEKVKKCFECSNTYKLASPTELSTNESVLPSNNRESSDTEHVNNLQDRCINTETPTFDELIDASGVVVQDSKELQQGDRISSHDENEYDSCFDTQEFISDHDETDNVHANECQKLTKNDTVLTRGPSIVKCYSLLTDEERKDLLRRAFEFKSTLQIELKDTNKILQKKMEELKTLQSKLETNYLCLEGEKEALSGTSMKLFPLFAERKFKEGSAEQIHFRIAESQFYRLLSSEMSPFKVTKVEYVINPALVHRFKSSKMRLEQYRCKEEALPLLGFHGTNIDNIISICSQGFRVPGENGFRHASDPGWYGSGVYFSEYPSYTMPYIRGASRVLLCQVLPGKVFQCQHVVLGEPLREGYDSHISPNGKELVIFNSHHILPSYIVYYKRIDGDYHYEIDE